MSKPRLLDLFCGAGGATKGYQRAGFYVVGVDKEPQPRYCGDEFVRGDALGFLRTWMEEAAEGRPFALDVADRFDAIHASPPCQFRSALRHLWPDRDYPNLIPPTRDLLLATGLPYVIENVPQARSELRSPVMLCGSSLGLDLRRHRLFECHGFDVIGPPCAHGWQTPRFEVHDRRAKSLSSVVSVAGHATPPTRLKSVVSVHGSSGGKGGVAEWRRAMGIDWMTRDELAQAIPPAYTELIGYQLLDHLHESRRAA